MSEAKDEIQRDSANLERRVSVLRAQLLANIYVLFHWDQCIYTESDRLPGEAEKVTFVGTCTGTWKDGTLIVKKTFYGKARFAH